MTVLYVYTHVYIYIHMLYMSCTKMVMFEARFVGFIHCGCDASSGRENEVAAGGFPPGFPMVSWWKNVGKSKKLMESIEEIVFEMFFVYLRG